MLEHGAKTDSSDDNSLKEQNVDNLKAVPPTKSVDKNTLTTLQKIVVEKYTASLKRSIVETLSEKLKNENLSKISDSKKYKRDNF